MYSFDLKNVVPSGCLTCLFVKAIIDESNLWHRRLGHIYFKTVNKLVQGNLVRGLPSKLFENNHTCVACQKGKQHKASCKTKLFRGNKGIKKKFSVARTPQQNRVAERKNRTLIETARTMLADSLLPTTFWTEAVSIACYVQNRVLVTKPHNETPYELLHGRPPSISFMRPFGCPVTILNTLDPLGKFDGKANEGFFVGYSINSKAFRVFNTRTRKVEENLHITFLENKPNVAGSGLDWLFDIDLLTNSMNYELVTTGNQTNKNAGIKDNVDAVPTQQYILLPLLYYSLKSSKDVVADDAGKKPNEEPLNEGERNGQEKLQIKKMTRIEFIVTLLHEINEIAFVCLATAVVYVRDLEMIFLACRDHLWTHWRSGVLDRTCSYFALLKLANNLPRSLISEELYFNSRVCGSRFKEFTGKGFPAHRVGSSTQMF
ncbi:ribonuclease H-like domain-containing protein [Tanacetum coccineum]